jgi:trehalose/maltose hydrolase-like predicted phosphorylase
MSEISTDVPPAAASGQPASEADRTPAATVPDVYAPTDDPLWLMVDDEFTATREHEFESLFAVSNGYLGSRGSMPLGIPSSDSSVFIAGAFDIIAPSSLPELVAVPGWTLLAQRIGSDWLAVENLAVDEHRRILDMRQGIFRRFFRFSDRQGRTTLVRFLRIASLADRHVLLQSSLCTPENYGGPLAIRSGFLQAPGSAGTVFSSIGTNLEIAAGPVLLVEGRTHTKIDIALAVAARISTEGCGVPQPQVRRTAGRMDDLMELEVEAGKTYRIDWIEVCYTSRDIAQPADSAVAHLQNVLGQGVRPALHRHVAAWNSRWSRADVTIAGDQDAQRAIRFACYHLISAANPDDEHVSIGAKALTGSAYKGHVFWDTEIFLLPFYTLTDPPSARALLMYRFHTLAAARDKAQRAGYRGALYAWESADTGEDVTPPYAITPIGGLTPVLTGVQAHHISADVAYAVWQYWQATGDDAFLCDAGAEILMETARFWASRARAETDGKYHIREVIGPDEYHLTVDDNAYTNWIACWNLECAAGAAQLLQTSFPECWQRLVLCMQLKDDEPKEWLAIAAMMYRGIDAGNGLIEQFDGYHELAEIDLAQYAPRSLPIDIILGHERTQGAKIIKQADVVMLLHLLWERIPAAARETNFRYYEPRTEHGSSLSPAMHALIAARLGDMDTALRYFRQAREIDLANNMGNASGGVHIAALGGMWQTIVFGFAGLTLRESGLGFMPHCPAAWHSIRFVLLWRGQKLQVHIEPGAFEAALLNGTSVPVSVADMPAVQVDTGRTARWELKQGSWKEVGHECS